MIINNNNDENNPKKNTFIYLTIEQDVYIE